MDLEALRFANFKLLDDAIEDWTTMVDNLEDLEKSATKGLKNAANKANWAGVNATVSKEFIGKTAEEFKDAHTQAKTIRDILRDTRGELKGYHKQLDDAIERTSRSSVTRAGSLSPLVSCQKAVRSSTRTTRATSPHSATKSRGF